MSLPPGSRLGSYEILAPLGAGGMGEVFRAKDTRLGREVALKILPATKLGDETSRSQLLREAQTASSLNHPHICTIYETGEADERLFIAMELVPGQNLSTLIGHEGLPADTAIRYGVQLADALSHAHLQGVVHRDLKPGNVMVTPEGRTKILDFGLASRATTDLNDVTRSEAPLTEHAGLGGTLPYMAPEQLRGEAATVASDHWSLGVMLYEMTCGRRPFQGRTGYEITSAVLRDTPPPLPAGLPAGLRAVIQRCLTKEPGQRYRQAGEIRAALEAIALESSGAVLPAVVSTRRFGVRALWAVGAIIVLAAFLVSKFGRPTGPGAARPVSLAVLPLQNLSGDSTQEYFSDGMTEALISDLAQIRALKVISRTSVMHYKKTDKLLSQIAGELGVT